MLSDVTTADVTPGEVASNDSSDDDDGDTDDHSIQQSAEVIVLGANAGSDVTSEEYSSRIQELSRFKPQLRASIATALQERSDAEAQENLYGKRLDAKMSKSGTLKKGLRTSEMERIQLRDNLDQLEVDLQSEPCSVPEHALMKEELLELNTKHLQLEKQHKQQALMLAEFQKDNATLEVRLSNVGIEKSVSLTESGRLMAHVASMERRAIMANAESFPPVAYEAGDLDGDLESIDTDHQGDDQYIAGSQEVYRGGYLKSEKSNPHIERVNAAILEDDDSTTDEMLIQKTLKGAGTIMGKGDDLEKFHIQSAKEFNIDWFERWFRKLHSLGVSSLVAQEFGHMLQYREVVGSSEELKTWKKNQGGFLDRDIYHGEKMYEAITAGKHQQLQVAVGRYLRNNGKKTLSSLSTVIARVFRFVCSTAICARNLKLMNYIRGPNMTDVQYALTVQHKMDEMRRAEAWSTQEDMFCTNIMGQFGAAVENAFPKLMSLWPSGQAGYDFIEALTSHIIDHGDVTSLTHSHQMAYGLGAPSENGYTQKQKDKYQRRKAKLAEKSKNNQGRNLSYPDIPADIDPKEHCTCCGSRQHLFKNCPRSDFDCHCCGKQGHMKHCCPCEDCKKTRKKSDKRTGRTQKANKTKGQ